MLFFFKNRYLFEKKKIDMKEYKIRHNICVQFLGILNLSLILRYEWF